MRFVVLILCLMLASGPALAETVPASQAASHIGQSVTVEGIVVEVHTTKSGITFLDIGARYPNQVFVGVIFPENASSVGDVDGLLGKTVDLSGTVQLYKGSPEIILRSRAQVKLR